MDFTNNMQKLTLNLLAEGFKQINSVAEGAGVGKTLAEPDIEPVALEEGLTDSIWDTPMKAYSDGVRYYLTDESDTLLYIGVLDSEGLETIKNDLVKTPVSIKVTTLVGLGRIDEAVAFLEEGSNLDAYGRQSLMGAIKAHNNGHINL